VRPRCDRPPPRARRCRLRARAGALAHRPRPPGGRVGLGCDLGLATVALDRVLALARGDLVLQALALDRVLGACGFEPGLGLRLARALGSDLGVRLCFDLGLLQAALASKILVAEHRGRRLLHAARELAGKAAAGALGDFGIRHV
jgi:hypothetical protein